MHAEAVARSEPAALAEGWEGPEDDPMETAGPAGVRCMTPLVLRFATLEASDGCIKVPPAGHRSQTQLCSRRHKDVQASSDKLRLAHPQDTTWRGRVLQALCLV